MVVTCKASGCCTARTNNGISFHQFPTNHEKCLAWIKACGLEHMLKNIPIGTFSKKYSLCGKHFTEDSYRETIGTLNKRLLKPGTVPTLHLVPKPKNISPVKVCEEKIDAEIETYLEKNGTEIETCKDKTNYDAPEITVSLENEISYACFSVTDEPISPPVLSKLDSLKTYENSCFKEDIIQKQIAGLMSPPVRAVYDNLNYEEDIIQNKILETNFLPKPVLPIADDILSLKEDEIHNKIFETISLPVIFDPVLPITDDISGIKENIFQNKIHDVISPSLISYPIPLITDKISSFQKNILYQNKFDDLTSLSIIPDPVLPDEILNIKEDKIYESCSPIVLSDQLDTKIHEIDYPEVVSEPVPPIIDTASDIKENINKIKKRSKRRRQLTSNFNSDNLHLVSQTYSRVKTNKNTKQNINPVCCEETVDAPETIRVKNKEPDFLKLCRLCATSNKAVHGGMIDLFSAPGQAVLYKIQQYIPIEIHENDGYPHRICSSCCLKVNTCYDLITMCYAATTKLHDLKQKAELRLKGVTVFTADDLMECDDDDSLPEVPLYEMDEPDLILQQSYCDSDISIIETPQENYIEFEDIVLPDIPDVLASSCVHVEETKTLAVILAQQRLTDHSPRLSIVLVDLKSVEVTREAISEAATIAVQEYREMNYIKGKDIKSKKQYKCLECEFTSEDSHRLESHIHQKHENKECDDNNYCKNNVQIEKFFRPSLDSLQLGYFKTDLSGNSALEQAINLLGLTLFHRKIKSSEVLKLKIEKPLKQLLSQISDTKLPDSFIFKNFNLEVKQYHVAVMCNVCGTVIKNIKNLKRHIKSKHIDKPKFKGSCCHCDNPVRKNKLLCHIELHHARGIHLMCKICDEQYTLTGETQPHMHTESHKSFKCHYIKCRRGFLKETTLKKHIKKVHETGDVIRTCNFCLKEFKCRKSLVEHINIHLDLIYTDRSEYICELCGKVFNCTKSLNVHKLHVHSERIECKICNKFYRPKYMPVHIMRHNNIRFQCTQCSKSYTTKAELKYHELRHKGIGFTKCPICNESFKSLALMKKHKRLHDNGSTIILPPHKQVVTCNICGKKCPNKYLLTNHMYKHSTIYPNACVICGANFINNAALKTHVETKHITSRMPKLPTNKDSKKFPCQYCDKSYRLKQMLVDHESKHMGIKNQSCHLCDAKFYYCGSKYKHLHKKHNISTGMKGISTSIFVPFDINIEITSDVSQN